jgi:leucyl aminopeptidase
MLAAHAPRRLLWRSRVDVALCSLAAQDRTADALAIFLFEEQAPPPDLPEQVRRLIASGEARAKFRALAHTHVQGQRWIVVGLGARDRLDPERLRIAGALAHDRALDLACGRLALRLPEGADGEDPEHARALLEGALLADYRFDRYRRIEEGEGGRPRHLQALLLPVDNTASKQLGAALREAQLAAQATNEARDLQNRPGNDLTPSALAEHARALAEEIPGLSARSEGRAALIERGMGAFAAVAQGSEQEPALITMRYEPPAGRAAGSPVLGLVGKAITFDSGGISLKAGAKMSEMKFDMSGGAAVICAIGAIARLELPIEIVGVVGATENLPSGRAVKPGDIVRAMNGKSIEINNTDAEGRLVLADCLTHAAAQGAELLVDLATLTGAVIIALGSAYAGLMANDDDLAKRLIAAGRRSGERLWRLPLDEEYEEMIKGRYAELDNAPEGRKAGTIIGGTFLSHFTSSLPWAHLDIAGCAWDLGRPYAAKGGSGFGVRLLIELARSLC